MTTTAAVKDCTTCTRRKSQVGSSEQAVGVLARKLANAQSSDLAPHLQRGIYTQLEKAKRGRDVSRKALEDHQFGECGR